MAEPSGFDQLLDREISTSWKLKHSGAIALKAFRLAVREAKGR
jgi:hypothetical protein